MGKSLKLLILTCITLTIAACTDKQKSQYVGEWLMTDVADKGQTWDKSLLPNEEMTLTINADGSLFMKMGEYNEKAYWHLDTEGNIVMAEQVAEIDDEGHLIADHDGLLVRFSKK